MSPQLLIHPYGSIDTMDIESGTPTELDATSSLPGISAADALDQELSHIAASVAKIKDPLPEGLDVLIAQIIVLGTRVRDGNIALEERIRTVEKEKEEVAGDLQLCQNRLIGLQENLSSALEATATAEGELDAKVTEVDSLRRENKLALRDRDEAESRLATELASWEKIKADWAEREAHYKESVKSHARVNKDLKSETELKESQFNDSFEVQQSSLLESSKAALKEKDVIIHRLQEDLQKAEANRLDLQQRLNIAHDEVKSQRLENGELTTQIQSLMEDNELYQVLLRERTLNGEFKMKSVVMSDSFDEAPPRVSLSDELGGTRPTITTTPPKKSQMEELEEQNKALQLFIDKILKKILEDDDLEAKLTSNPNTPSSPAAATPSRRWPFAESSNTSILSVASPTRSASPNRTRTGLRADTPRSVQRNASPLRSPATPPRTPPKRKAHLTVATGGFEGGSLGPLSAPAARNPHHVRSGTVLEVAVAAASTASEANFPRRASQATVEPLAGAAAAASTSTLAPLDDDDEEPYVPPPPRVQVDAAADDGTGSVFTGFMRRISNAFASLTSPAVAEEKKELPIVEEAAASPMTPGVPPPPSAEEMAIAVAKAAEAEAPKAVVEGETASVAPSA
ncbi:hypothetical protein HDU97_007769 [Phlyctochytrium planicorne]|nr:hypothetical protein HDU97_007769 [Phlyctochytrium planicorne]